MPVDSREAGTSNGQKGRESLETFQMNVVIKQELKVISHTPGVLLWKRE